MIEYNAKGDRVVSVSVPVGPDVARVMLDPDTGVSAHNLVRRQIAADLQKAFDAYFDPYHGDGRTPERTRAHRLRLVTDDDSEPPRKD